MPTYECALLFKMMPKDKLVAAVKRTAGLIFEEGGIIRKLNNLGEHPTPFKATSHGKKHTRASFFVIEFDCPTFAVAKLRAGMKKDSDIVFPNFYDPVQPFDSSTCALEEETRPPPFRPEVQKIIKLAEKKRKTEECFRPKPNTGLAYDPFPS